MRPACIPVMDLVYAGFAPGRDFSVLPVIDGLLAATAVHYDLTLVTRDTRHLGSTGVAYFNPWEG